MECDQGLPSSELILFYCSAIFQDLIDIEIAGFPYQTPDLMMEQGKEFKKYFKIFYNFV